MLEGDNSSYFECESLEWLSWDEIENILLNSNLAVAAEAAAAVDNGQKIMLVHIVRREWVARLVSPRRIPSTVADVFQYTKMPI